jgi:hypothetical protein
MSVSVVVAIVLAVYSAVLTALKVIAPMTKNTVDDKVEAAMEKAQPAVDFVADKVKPAPVK